MKQLDIMKKATKTAVLSLFAAAALALMPFAASAASVTTTFSNTFFGEAGAAVEDFFAFDAQATGSNSAEANVTVSGLENVTLSLFEADAEGNAQGDAIASIDVDGSATLKVSGLSAGAQFLLGLTGNIAADIGAGIGTVVGDVTTVIPLPPAILLFLTGLGALFGFTGLRKQAQVQAA